ncbi:hypothetical protein LP419_00240 [Massilia sp. H-1]|nr:hypothetical protein LP419_00240 [Massilia sp. H-1]
MLTRFKSLEGRIATLFLVLIISVQVIGLLMIQRGIDANARATIATELANGEKVFRKLMEQSAQKQRFQAQVLARDTAFVQAIGNGGQDDRATIESALDNSSRSARADLTMLIDGERKVSVSTGIIAPARARSGSWSWACSTAPTRAMAPAPSPSSTRSRCRSWSCRSRPRSRSPGS